MTQKQVFSSLIPITRKLQMVPNVQNSELLSDCWMVGRW